MARNDVIATASVKRLQLEVAWLAPVSDATGLSSDKLRAYTAALKEQATEIEGETQSLRFHPRYAALIIEGPFGVPMVIDGVREMERLDGMIEQLDAALLTSACQWIRHPVSCFTRDDTCS